MVRAWQGRLFGCGYAKTYSALHCRLHTGKCENYVWFCMFVTDSHSLGPDLSTVGILNLSKPTLMVPQVSDKMRARIVVWHDEQHLSAQEISGLLDVGSGIWRSQYNTYKHNFETLVVQTAMQSTVQCFALPSASVCRSSP